MSVEASAWAFAQSLAATQKLLLIALADSADSDGECWPSQGRLAAFCGLSRQSINRLLGELEAAGLITYLSRRRDNGSESSCRYRLLIPAGPEGNSQLRAVPGFVYLVRSPVAFKIGISRDVAGRLAGLRGQSPIPVDLIGQWPMTMARARRVESAAHELLKEKRLRGEWFEVEEQEARAAIEAAIRNGGVSSEDTPLSHCETPPVSEEDTPLSHCETPRSYQKEEEDSDSSQSSESAAPSMDAAPADPIKVLFDAGVRLYTAAGVPEKQARRLIGKQRREFGDAAVMSALQAAAAEHATEPVAFVAACLARSRSSRETRSRDLTRPESIGGYVPPPF